MTRVKILLANKFFFLKGGSEKVFFQERSFLFSQGYRVIDFSMEDPRNLPSEHAPYFVSNIDYERPIGTWEKVKQSAEFIRSREAIGKIEEIVERERPEIAHLHNIYHQLSPSIIPVLKSRGVKVVLTVHDGKLICPSYLMLRDGEVCTACRGRYFWKIVTRRCQSSPMKGFLLMLEGYWHAWKETYQLVDLFLAPSEFIAELISERIPEDRIQLLRNGINLADFNPSCQDDGYVLYFGRLSKEKGIETLLKAQQSMRNCPPLRVVGTGPMEDALRRKYLDAQFLGYKDGKELNEIIGKAAFVVVPSEWNENCSMVILEAMAMGKAVIASAIGGIPEQIEDGVTGFLFQTGSIAQLSKKMEILTANSELRKEMGKAARKKAEREFSLERHNADLLAIYHSVLQH